MDFSRPLIETANRHFKADNITYQLVDVSELDGVRGAYDRVLMSAALQHLSPAQADRMFARLIDAGVHQRLPALEGIGQLVQHAAAKGWASICDPRKPKYGQPQQPGIGKSAQAFMALNASGNEPF